MFTPKKDTKSLLIHCRRGLFTITKCVECKHVWECENCARNLQKGVNLVAYRSSFGKLELLCHQCQTYYKYPLDCPECGTEQIISQSGGIESLEVDLQEKYNFQVIRLDLEKKIDKFELLLPTKNEKNNSKIWLTTRIYDPLINYEDFDNIVFIQAQNLLASSDYLVQEEISNALGQIFLETQKKNVNIIFDTINPESNLFQNIEKLNQEHENHQSIWSWYKSFLNQEITLREIFSLPPFCNVILLTSHENSFEKAKNKLQAVKVYMEDLNREFDLNLQIQTPYPARFLKRKKLFSYHLLIKYPRKYDKFSFLRSETMKISSTNRLQIRHNPRHLF